MHKTPLLLGVLALLVGCSSDERPLDPGPGPGGGIGGVAGGCGTYPIPLQASPQAKKDAAQELAALSPNALMTWDDARGTLAAIVALDAPLADCTDGADLNAQIRLFLAAHAQLFQIDLDDWSVPQPFDCRLVPVDAPSDVTLVRQRLAGHVARQDFFRLAVRKIEGVVTVTAVTGIYLPAGSPALQERLGQCVFRLAQGRATAAASVMGLPAAIYESEDSCRPSSTLRYLVRAGDTFATDPDEWVWEQDGTAVTLRATTTLRITVASANYSPELLTSSARCPTGENGDDFTIGWVVTFDVWTGGIISVTPGLTCDVCS